MRFLFSFPLPLLLIFISPVVFDTQAAPSKLQEEPSPSRDYAEQSTTDIRYANSSYANRRHARQIGTDLSYDGVKPMALASEADSTETAENYEQLSFDELEKRKEQAEKDHSELKDKLNQARDALKTKEDEAKGPLDDYDKKKLAYEELSAKAEGMDTDLRKAEAEFKAAEDISLDANSTFSSAFDDLKTIEDQIAAANAKIAEIEGEPDRLTQVGKDLTALSLKCTNLKSTETAVKGDVGIKRGEEQKAQDLFNTQEGIVNQCTTACESDKTWLDTLRGKLATAKNAHQTAIDLAAYLRACPSETTRLTREAKDLKKSILNKDANVALEQDKITDLTPDKDAQQEIFDAAKLAKEESDPIYAQKLAAKEAAQGTRQYTPEQVQKAVQAALAAQNQWDMLKEGHTKVVDEIGSLQTALKELEKRFATDEARVGALQKVYQKKLSGKDPGNGSSTIIAVCAIVGLLLLGVGIGVFFALKRRNAKKKEQKPSGGKEKSSSADNAPPTTPGSTPGAVSTMKELGSGHLTPAPLPPAQSANIESGAEQVAPIAANEELVPYVQKGFGKEVVIEKFEAKTPEEIATLAILEKEGKPKSIVARSGNMCIVDTKADRGLGTQLRTMIGSNLIRGLCQDARRFQIITNLPGVPFDWSLLKVKMLNNDDGVVKYAADCCAFMAIQESGKYTKGFKIALKKMTQTNQLARQAVLIQCRTIAALQRLPAGRNESIGAPADANEMVASEFVYYELIHEMMQSKRIEEIEKIKRTYPDFLPVAIQEMLIRNVAELEIVGKWESENEKLHAATLELYANTYGNGVRTFDEISSYIQSLVNITQVANESEIMDITELSATIIAEQDNDTPINLPAEQDNDLEDNNSGRSIAGRERDEDSKSKGRKRKDSKKRNHRKRSERSKRDSEDSEDSRKNRSTNEDSRQVTDTQQNPQINYYENEKIIMIDGGAMPPVERITHDKNKKARGIPSPEERLQLARDIVASLKKGEEYDFKDKEEALLDIINYTVNDMKKLDRNVQRKDDKMPNTAVGDIHGNGDVIAQFIAVFNGEIGSPEWVAANKFVFTGDLVDRGPHGLEVVVVLFLMRSLWPEFVTLTRGNHEFYDVNACYGFYDECVRRFGAASGRAMHFYFNIAFGYMPLACTGIHPCGKKAFYAHGCIPRIDDFKLEEINTIIPKFVWSVDKATGIEMTRWRVIVLELVWDDPALIKDNCEGSRGAGWEVAMLYLKDFCKKNGIVLFFRGHQLMPNGYEIADDFLITGFASPGYEIKTQNRGAIMRITTDLIVSFIVLFTYSRDSIMGKTDQETVEYLRILAEFAKKDHNANNFFFNIKGGDGNVQTADRGGEDRSETTPGPV